MPITKVTFKVETFVDSHPAGPVTLIDEELLAADPVIADCRAKGLPGMPYGYKPLGMETLHPWRMRSEAVEIAASLGLELTEEGW